MILGFPGKAIAKIHGPRPRTASEARATSKRLNAEARRDRERKEQAHQARQRALDTLIEKNRAAAGTLRATRASSSVRGRGPRLDSSAVYRARAEATQPLQAKATTPAPRRARTLHDVIVSYYGAADAEAGALIRTTGRGGR